MAKLSQELNAGGIVGRSIGGLLPDRFHLEVKPGEDTGLPLVFAALVDVVLVHDASGSGGVVDPMPL